MPTEEPPIENPEDLAAKYLEKAKHLMAKRKEFVQAFYESLHFNRFSSELRDAQLKMSSVVQNTMSVFDKDISELILLSRTIKTCSLPGESEKINSLQSEAKALYAKCKKDLEDAEESLIEVAKPPQPAPETHEAEPARVKKVKKKKVKKDKPVHQDPCNPTLFQVSSKGSHFRPRDVGELGLSADEAQYDQYIRRFDK